MRHDNGSFNPGECPVAKDWIEHRDNASIAMDKIDVIHDIIKDISEHTSHLSKLDNISKTLVRAFVAQTTLVVFFFGAIALVVLLGDRGRLSVSPTHIDLERGQ